ncbi:MAG: amidase [Pseudomonadota bacterium]
MTEYTVTGLSRLLQSRELDAVALTEHFIDRITACADRAVFTSTSFERARQEAASSAARYREGRQRGPLDGVPICWKDLIDMAGLPTTAASAVYRYATPAATDACIVRNLANAGMVSIGKTNLSEFAYSGLGLNPHFGTPHNPASRDVPRAPGGSSSGAAVAVAAGLVPAAIGTDTGGSIRIPAAFNGLVGFKSSEGRIDKTGVFPLSTTLDTIGVLARSVTDCMMLDRALRGLAATTEVHPIPLAGLRLLVPENIVFDEIEAEVLDNFLASLERLKQAGARVSWRTVPQFEQLRILNARHGSIAAAEAYHRHRQLVDGPRSTDIDPAVLQRILGGAAMSAFDLVSLQQARVELQRALWAAAGDALLVMPTVAHVAPPLAPLEADLNYFAEVNLKTLRNTMLGNMLDLCGLALPNGVGHAQMPTGILFNAQAGREDFLLRAGIAISEVL